MQGRSTGDGTTTLSASPSTAPSQTVAPATVASTMPTTTTTVLRGEDAANTLGDALYPEQGAAADVSARTR